MARVGRSPFSLRGYTSKLLSRWLTAQYKKGKEIFTMREMCMGIKYDPDDRHSYTRVYQVIVSWRNKAKNYIKVLKMAGGFKYRELEKNWDAFLDELNSKHGIFILYADKDHTYFQPTFHWKEINDQKRAIKQAKGMLTIIKEFDLYDEKLLLTGKPIGEALKEANNFVRGYLTGRTMK